MKKRDQRPPHQRIASEIRARVMAGDLRPGSKLQTTGELMTEFQTTNPTIQKALRVLKAEGLLIGQAGVGVFVADKLPLAIAPITYLKPGAPKDPHPWIGTPGPAGAVGAIRLLSVKAVDPPAAIRESLELGEQELAVVRRQLLLLDEAPAEIADIYFPSSIAADTPLAKRQRIRGGSIRVLEELSMPVHEWVDRITTRLPTTAELETLDLPDDVPVLRTLRIGYTALDRPVQAEILIKGGNMYELQYSRLA